MKKIFSKCLLLLSIMAFPITGIVVQATDLGSETTSAIQFIGSSTVCGSVDFTDSSECGIYEPVIDLADQAAGIIENFIQSYDDDTKIYVYEYLLDYFEDRLAESNVTNVERIYFGWIAYTVMESLDSISDDIDLSDILCDLFGGTDCDNQVLSELSINRGDGIVSAVGQGENPTRTIYYTTVEIHNETAVNPVLSYEVPDGIGCLEKVYMLGDITISQDGGDSRTIWNNNISSCTEVTDIKIVLWADQSEVGIFYPSFHFLRDEFSYEEYCLDVLFSSDNAQYSEDIACNTVCADGIDETFEQCDDGNLVGGDGCDQFCRDECNVYTDEGVFVERTCDDVITGDPDTLSIDVIEDHNLNYLNYITSVSDSQNLASDRVFSSTVPGGTCLIVGLSNGTFTFGDDTQFLELSFDNGTSRESYSESVMNIYSCAATNFRLVYPDGEDIDNEYTIPFRGRGRPLNEYCIDMEIDSPFSIADTYANCTNDRHGGQMQPSDYDLQFLEDFGTVEIETDMTIGSSYIVAGTSSDDISYTVGFDIAVYGNPVYLSNFSIGVEGGGNFSDSVSTIELYDQQGQLLVSKPIGNGDRFIHIDNEVLFPVGLNKLFIKLITERIGNTEAGSILLDNSLNILVGNAYSSNGFGITPSYPNSSNSFTLGSNTILYTEDSAPFSVVPVSFSDAEFVTTAAGVSVSTSTTDGIEKNLAILKLTASDRNNTDRTNGSNMEAIVSRLRFEVSNPIGLSNYEIKRIGNGSTNYIAGNIDGDMLEFNLDLADVNTKEFTEGEVGYYLIRADVQFGQTNGTIKLTLDNLNGGVEAPEAPIVYAPSDDLSEQYRELRIEDDLIESSSVTINNN